MSEEKYALIYGSVIGNFDVENIFKYIDQNGLTACTVYLDTEPVQTVTELLKSRSNVKLEVVKKPGREAKLKEKELKSADKQAERVKLEKVSDRSSFRGGC